MIVVPEMITSQIGVHNGNGYYVVEVKVRFRFFCRDYTGHIFSLIWLDVIWANSQ